MNLLELVKTMYANEKLFVRYKGVDWETSPDEIMDKAVSLHNKTVLKVWVSYNLYNALVIELE